MERTDEDLSADIQPVVSVIIATYNWSAVLGCAIESVLLQTFKNFEVVVVGDGCTDDSEKVGRSFGDKRIRWMNLSQNSGTQAATNNMGLEMARGRYVAYLGHDDIWFPTHLESLIATIQREKADIVGAVMVLYGPPTSGVMSVSGVFASGEYSDREFLPPSSILHEKSLIAKIGAWDESLALCIPTDVDFLKRAFNAGAKIVSSGELTVFKFNAASRRNAYLTRSAIEQEGIFAHIRNGIDIRLPAMIDVIRSVVADKYIRIEAPKPGAPGEWYRHNAHYKGTLKEAVRLRSVEERIRFYLDDQLGGFEWHGPEPSEHWISARWSGPSLAATVEFPVSWEAGLSVLVHVVGHFQRNIADDVQLFANAERLEAKFESTPEGTILISAIVPPRCSGAEKVGESEPLRLTFRVARTQRLLDLGINQDRRWLGIAVNWVEVAPLASDDAEAVDVPSPS